MALMKNAKMITAKFPNAIKHNLVIPHDKTKQKFFILNPHISKLVLINKNTKIEMEEISQIGSSKSFCNTKVSIKSKIHKNNSSLAKLEANLVELQQKQS